MKAARYLKVPPWELEQQPMIWRQRALMAEGIEIEVHNIRIKNNQK